jgi:multidrug resistance efflux pump
MAALAEHDAAMRLNETATEAAQAEKLSAEVARDKIKAEIELVNAELVAKTEQLSTIRAAIKTATGI